MRRAIPPLIILALLCAACAQEPPPPPPPPVKQPTVFDAQLKALDRAKAVQDIVNQQQKDMDKKLQDQGG